MLPHKMVVNLNMFGAFNKDIIMCDVNGALVVTIVVGRIVENPYQ